MGKTPTELRAAADQGRPVRAFQWDLARQIERPDFLLSWLPRYAEWGYQELYLHLEDAVEFPSLPGVARPGAYTHRQLGRLVEAATRVGLRVVPIVNLLGHTQYLVKTPELRDLNERRAPDGRPLENGQICPLHPRTLEVAEKLLRDMAPFCTAGLVHVGLDESYHLGKCPRCRAEVERIGLGRHFAGHVERLRTVTRSLGLRMGLWADMLYFVPDALPLLPRDVVAYEWYYHPFSRRPRIELFNFRETDLGERLRRRGLALYGCPMNGAFRWEPLPLFRERLENIVSWWRACRRTGAEGFLVTSWEPNRLAAELPIAVDAAAAGLWLDHEEDPRRLFERGCQRVFGNARGPRAARLFWSADRFPYAGHARWRIESRWDTVATLSPLAPFRAEERSFRRLATEANVHRLPVAVRASLEWRHYVARRERFVQETARTLLAWRRRRTALHLETDYTRLTDAARAFARTQAAARRAAEAMWKRSRPAGERSSNLAVLAADRARLKALLGWLKEAWCDPTSRFSPGPLLGRWQLFFRVENFEPALQRFAVERRRPEGDWETLHALFLIEFQARAARPRAHVVRQHSAPLDWDGISPLELRLAARGFGRFRAREFVLTDGVSVRRLVSRRPITLGRPSPRAGWPEFDWDKTVDAHPLRFAEKAERAPRFVTSRGEP